MLRTDNRSVVVLAIAFIALNVLPPAATAQSTSPVPMHALNRVIVGTSDRMTSVRSEEGQNHQMEGQVLYAPSISLNGTTPLYRLYLGKDHMDSLSPSEGGYSNEGIIAYGWTSPASMPGLVAYSRAYNWSTGDHMNYITSEPLPSGYNHDGTAMYGFPRYNNRDSYLVSFSGGGITANANLVTGGAIWDWTWSGKQFVNDVDCGRQIQTALQSVSHSMDAPECGDRYWNVTVPEWKRHGAPLASYSVTSSTFSSEAIPLDFGAQFGNPWGTSQNKLNAWLNWRIGKKITLNFNNMGPIAKYEARVVAPVRTIDGTLEHPMIYMPSEFNRFWTYDANTNTLTEVTSRMPDGCSSGNPGYNWNPTAHGGVIASDSTGNYAMGLYGGTTASGGSATYFAMWKFWCANTGSGQYRGDSSKLDIVYGGVINSGTTTYSSYIVNGSVNDVAKRMAQLHAAGYY